MKTYKIVNNDISDGYHTFEELYEHRIALFIYALNQEVFIDVQIEKNHFEGWDLILCYTKSGDQISYHIPSGKSNLITVKMSEMEHEWDGHLSSDVVKRLLK